MPWDQTSAMDQKRLFIADYLSRSFTIVELGERYGISRPTAYKWIRRFLQRGYSGLDELPRRPSRCPHRTDDKLVEVILDLRRKHPTWGAKKLLEWHREKAGSIEALHDVLKNDLAAGVMPCGRFGANAAWLRLAVMTHNVLTALKRLALQPEWLRARPKRLRFHFFCSPGKLVHHARRLLARVGRRAAELIEWADAWRMLPLPT